ncbi:hypothetical protein QYE76_020854 [Lolium multiflorum]|uniref:Protein FAR1-RELATED SEQUENCE n=1 Tax=Lolium multiflorum TaxID=4521 RepID=A0AAD8R6N9_LOLMU|nr:hypothetical protein QYE76_020854 [Lolium multiflorum]
MDLTLEYFKKRQDENPNFYYAKDVNEDNAVRALFWVDGRTRLLYPKYKDCVFFDTTFCTNRYNMPFAPIVGINNHLQTVVLGCALLANETKDGFRWVFERVMVHLNIQVIPDRYLLERWSQAASKGAPVPDANTRPHMFGIPRTNTLRYNRLCRKMNRLASDACFSDETYELVSAAIDSVSAVVDAKRRGGDTQQEGEPDVVQVQAQQQTTA